MMTKQEIIHRIDHTLLKPEASWDEVQALCDEAAAFHAASVCISPVYVNPAADYLNGRLPVCTVVGFPSGAATTVSKVQETLDAIKNGADEIDMVIHIGAAKMQLWDGILAELSAVKKACGNKILKVIIETCLLSDEEKVTLCDLVSRSGADYIKTSTGFSTGGATLRDIVLFRRNLAPHVKIKAAGGVRTWEDAAAFLKAGADRLGSSALIPLARMEGRT